LAGEDPQRLEAAAKYLRQHASQPDSNGDANQVAA